MSKHEPLGDRQADPMYYRVGSRCRPRCLSALLVTTALVTRALAAQTSEPTALAVDTITATDVARHAGVFAQDSMRARDTPSRALDRTARYVAEQFEALGLQPLFGEMIQRYPLPGHSPVNYGESRLLFVAKPKYRGRRVVGEEKGWPVWNSSEVDFATGAAFATDTVLDFRAPGARGGGQGMIAALQLVGPPPVVVAGPHTVTSIRQANLHDNVVVYVPAAELDSAGRREVVDLLAVSNHVIIVADEDSAAFAMRRRAAQAHPPVILEWYLPESEHPRRWAMYVWAPAIQSALATAGFDLNEARTARAPIVRELLAVAMLQAAAGAPDSGRSAPNVVGMLPGSDPMAGVVVLTAHMDNVGSRRAPVDRTPVGIDDNTSGVVGLLVLAKAFLRAAKAGAPPRFSIVFAAASGGAKAAWGSNALAATVTPVLDINLDQIGRAVGDSVWISGIREVELPVQPVWLAIKHPELHLTAVDGGSVATPESDHFAFVRRSVPSLYVRGGVHGAAVGGADAAALVDAEREAQVLRFVFYLTQALASAPQAPRWNAAGRERRSRVLGH